MLWLLNLCTNFDLVFLTHDFHCLLENYHLEWMDLGDSNCMCTKVVSSKLFIWLTGWEICFKHAWNKLRELDFGHFGRIWIHPSHGSISRIWSIPSKVFKNQNSSFLKNILPMYQVGIKWKAEYSSVSIFIRNPSSSMSIY